MPGKPLSRRRLLRRTMIVGAGVAGAMAVSNGRADAATATTPTSTSEPETTPVCALDLLAVN